MSKSLGNSPDPLELIRKYSADGVRVGMLLCAPAGNDLLFDESLTEQGRNFSNKIWNAFRLIHGWQVDESLEQPAHSKLAVDWIVSQINRALASMEEQFGKYRISDALMIIYRLFWDEFSSWYLEMIKPATGQPIDGVTYDRTLGFIDQLLHMLHPFMPFITEEIWQLLAPHQSGESLMISPLPVGRDFDQTLLEQFEEVKEVVTSIRAIRKDKKLPPREALKLWVRSSNGQARLHQVEPVVKKLAQITGVEEITSDPENSVSFIVKNVEYYIPLGDMVDTQEEIGKLEAELQYTSGFLASVEKKLQNERFVQNAPEAVVNKERQKMADARTKIDVLEAQLTRLRSE